MPVAARDSTNLAQRLVLLPVKAVRRAAAVAVVVVSAIVALALTQISCGILRACRSLPLSSSGSVSAACHKFKI